jgi:Uma2 family endonuclease
MATSSSVSSHWPMIVSDYLAGEETTRRRELVWGVVREPPAPFYVHQRLVTDLTVTLQLHVRRYGLGQVVVSPIDVVLDEQKALIVQPDIIFLSNDRLRFVRGQVWGAPDLVIEVLSPGSGRYDRQQKLGWYRIYGIREYWVVDPIAVEITVHSFGGKRKRTAAYGRRRTLRSRVLLDLRLPIADVFPG